MYSIRIDCGLSFRMWRRFRFTYPYRPIGTDISLITLQTSPLEHKNPLLAHQISRYCSSKKRRFVFPRIVNFPRFRSSALRSAMILYALDIETAQISATSSGRIKLLVGFLFSIRTILSARTCGLFVCPLTDLKQPVPLIPKAQHISNTLCYFRGWAT